MQRTSRTAAGVAVLVLGPGSLMACSNDDGASSSTTVDTVVATTTTGAGLPTDPEAYAAAFIEAWEQGDQDQALELATPTVAESAFAYESGGPGSWSLEQCVEAPGSLYCTFGAGGDQTVEVRVITEAASQGAAGAVTSFRVG